jgi:hypothetical protein
VMRGPRSTVECECERERERECECECECAVPQSDATMFRISPSIAGVKSFSQIE